MSLDAATLPQELTHNLQTLRADLENVQHEVEQALAVWRTTLVSEKREFQAALQEKEKVWIAQDTDWQGQKSVYDNKITELEQFYRQQTASVEQNALQALNDLDDSWQRDKLLWNQTANQRLRDLEHHAALLAAECQRREATETHAESRVVELAASLRDRDRQIEEQGLQLTNDRNAYDKKIQELTASQQTAQQHFQENTTRAVNDVIAAWQAEKVAWQAERAEFEAKLRAHETTFQLAVQEREHSHGERLAAVQRQADEEKAAHQNARAMYEAHLQEQEDKARADASACEVRRAEGLAAVQAGWDREKAMWQAERSAFESNLRTSREEFQTAQRNLERAQSEAAENLKAAWDRDKVLWQDSLQQMLQRFSVSELKWSQDLRALNEVVEEKKAALAAAEQQAAKLASHLKSTETFLHCQLEALQNQIDLLTQVFDLASRPNHPLRRKTDIAPASALR